MSVSVIVATYNSATLALTLASLAAQDYPAELMEVIVVDDGSEPPVKLGTDTHPNTRVVRVESGWGRSNAADIGIQASTGEIIYWVDADMILFSDNVREHAKWAHFIPDAATIGEKGFVADWDLTPSQVATLVRSGGIAALWDFEALEPHWSIGVFADTDELNSTDGKNYSTHMGACATVTRSVLERAGGQDVRLHLGEDTEIAYRIWQAGGVFIPARSARAWHLGPATISRHLEAVQHINDVYFAQRMPLPRYRRTAEHRVWEVPLLAITVRADVDSAACARTCVDLILNSTLTDVRVTLIAPWSRLSDSRRKVLSDPLVELRLLQEWFREDARVVFSEQSEAKTFPSPYFLELSPFVGIGSDVLRMLVTEIDGHSVGCVGYASPVADAPRIELWNTAAVSRATRHRIDGEPLVDAVDRVWGSRSHSEPLPDAVDLRTNPRPEHIRTIDPVALGREESLNRRLRRAETRLSALRDELSDALASRDEALADVARLRGRGLGRLFVDAFRATMRPRHR